MGNPVTLVVTNRGRVGVETSEELLDGNAVAVDVQFLLQDVDIVVALGQLGAHLDRLRHSVVRTLRHCQPRNSVPMPSIDGGNR